MSSKKISKLLKMFFVFFKIGAFTIGGGYAMLPLIEKEVVENQKWIEEKEIIDVFAIVQSVPGVIAINSSIYLGYRIAGLAGALAAALGVILPSFVVILIIAFMLFSFNENIYIQKAFGGIRAGVTAMIGLTAVKLGKSVIKDKAGVILAAASFIAIVVFDIHAIFTILAGGLAGYLIYGLRKKS
ncbi:MAG: chromate transporter [Acetivibrionales bacterium]